MMRGNIDERGRKLFIGGIHLKTTEDSLKAFYSQWGDLIDVVVMRDPHTGKSRGFGFVTYNDPASVDLAQGNRPHEIDGIKVDAKRAMPKEDTSPEFHATVNRLFVGRLKKNLTAEDMKQYFSEYGTIADAVIINSPAGESRGFGFVTFEDPDSVDKIIVSRPHQLDGQTVEVKKALPRDADNKGNTRSSTAGDKVTPRGGYSNNSYNSRYQDAPSNNNSNSSFGTYRTPYSTNTSVPYSQNYSASNKAANNPSYSDSFETGYSKTYDRDHEYDYGQYSAPAGAQYNAPSGAQYNVPSGAQYNAPSGAQYNAPSGAQYSAPGGTYNPPSGHFNPPRAPYNNAPGTQQPNRGYGYPPRASMGEYNQKPAGGPMRGTTGGFGRGGPRYGTNPY